MAALDFPASPTLNQTYTANGRTWTWDGTSWNSTPISNVVVSVTGTANEITATTVSGATTLSLPSSLTFTGKTITGGTFSSPTLTTPALGTPSSGTVTNLTGTASININGTVGATTANTGAFTTLTGSTLNIGSAPNANSRAWALQGFGYINGASGNGIEWRNSTTGNSSYITNDTGDKITFNGLGGVVISQGGLAVTGALSATDNSSVTKSTNGVTSFSVSNVSTGTSAFAAYYLTNSSGTNQANIGLSGGSYTSVVGWDVQNALTISNVTAGGISIAARSGSSSIRNYIGDGTAAITTVTSTGLGIGNTPTAQLQVGTGTDAVGGTGTGQICLSGAGSTLAVTGKPAVYHRNSVGLGLYSDYAISFEVNGGTTKKEAARIDSSGKFVIGQTDTSSGIFTVNSGSDGGCAAFITSASVCDIRLVDSGTTNGQVRLRSQSGTMQFLTNTTERVRIDSSGNLLVGTTSAGGKLVVSQTASSTNAILVDIQSTSTKFCEFTYQGSNVGSISYNGSNTVYATTSDYRLKDLTGPLTDSGAFIDSLKPKVGTWKSNGSKFVGFVAHEFAEVSPSSVTGEKDAVDAEGKPVYQGMQASSAEVIANLVAELQSLRQRVAALESN